MTGTQRRQPEGTPAGGEFASVPHAEPDISLADGGACAWCGSAITDPTAECPKQLKDPRTQARLPHDATPGQVGHACDGCGTRLLDNGAEHPTCPQCGHIHDKPFYPKADHQLTVEVDEAAVCSDHGISLVAGCYECDPEDFDAAGARLSDEDIDTRNVRRRLVAMKTAGLLDSLTDSSDAEQLVELDRLHPNGPRELAVRAMSLYVRDLGVVAGDAPFDHDARLEDLREIQARVDVEMAEACEAKIAADTLARFPNATVIAVTNGNLRDDVMAPKFVFDQDGKVIGDVDGTEKWRRAVAPEIEDLGRTDAVHSMFDRGSLVVLDTDLAGARVMERTAALGSPGTIGNYRLLLVRR